MGKLELAKKHFRAAQRLRIKREKLSGTKLRTTPAAKKVFAKLRSKLGAGPKG